MARRPRQQDEPAADEERVAEGHGGRLLDDAVIAPRLEERPDAGDAMLPNGRTGRRLERRDADPHVADEQERAVGGWPTARPRGENEPPTDLAAGQHDRQRISPRRNVQRNASAGPVGVSPRRSDSPGSKRISVAVSSGRVNIC